MRTLDSLKEEVRGLLPAMEGERFDPQVFARSGVFVVRGAVAKGVVEEWKQEYYRQIEAEREKSRYKSYHPVEFLDLKAGLDGMWRHPDLLKVASQIYGADVGLFKRRFVIKDQNFRGNVFLHQDTAYQIGSVEKTSFFLALTEAGPRNGGMVFYPGTFRFGYLGDAGEINRQILPPDWPTLHPSLAPGDMAVMQSMTWHESSAFVEGPDRIITDFIYQKADDPSTIEVVAGEGGWEANFLNAKRGENFQTALFQRSRTTTINDLKRQLEAK